ncbi:cobalamin biosynthesis protein, partial [Pelomonas sp. KK5]|uniref:cobalamin biosynthesis protein n=1 Tax=Pelomonas sp. KK5 TaxID=1855730 RepID=UPI00117CFC0B
MMMMNALAIALALGLDRLFGEPPAAIHPVVGMGRYLSVIGARIERLRPAPAFIGGALAWLSGAALVGALA